MCRKVYETRERLGEGLHGIRGGVPRQDRDDFWRRVPARLIGGLVVAAYFLLAACNSRPAVSHSEHRELQVDGLSVNLKRYEGSPLYNLESVGSVVNPLTKRVVEVSSAGNWAVAGWAVDQANKAPAAGVDVVIDGRAYRAQYGEDRLDVANHFNVPAYQKSGFKFTVPAGAIGKGRHELRVRVILSDRNAYQEGVPVPLEIQ